MQINPQSPITVSAEGQSDWMQLDAMPHNGLAAVSTPALGNGGDAGDGGGIDDIRRQAAEHIQEAYRAYCVRQNLPPKVRNMILTVRENCQDLHLLLEGMQRRVIESRSHNLLDQSRYCDCIEKLQAASGSFIEIHQQMDRFLDQVSKQAIRIPFDESILDKVTRLKEHVADLGRDLGFGDLTAAIKSVLGTDWNNILSSTAVRDLQFYARIFAPTAYTVVPILQLEEDKAILGTPDRPNLEESSTVEEGNPLPGALTETHPNLFKGLPYVKESTFHSLKTPYEELHGAELCIPLPSASGAPDRILVLKGTCATDPANIQYTAGILESKKAAYQEAAYPLDIPASFRNGFLAQYSVRDFLLHTPEDYARELQSAYDQAVELGKSKGFKKIADQFKESSFLEQVRLITLLVLIDNRYPQQLFNRFLQTHKEYSAVLRQALHHSIQKTLNTWDIEFAEIQEKVAKAKTRDLDFEARVMHSLADEESKAMALEKAAARKRGSEEGKADQWLEGFLKIPFGKYVPQAVSIHDGPEKVSAYMNKVRETIDKAVYGQEDAKKTIMEVLGQWIAKDNSKGECIALQGPPGNGKTTFAKEGLAKALGRPFVFIGLGGSNDGVYLKGHSYTYVGSTPGKIVEGLQKAGVMNPIIYVDELDKISQTEKGRELVGILTHLVDFSQNDRFEDSYYKGVNLDLSKALFVFSYNDESMIDPILKDRMITIRTKGLCVQEKLVIAQKYLVPSILEAVGMQKGDIEFSDDVVRHIVDKYTGEAGVRRLKEALFTICRQINLDRLLSAEQKLPVTVTVDKVTELLKEPRETDDRIPNKPQVGTVNGLYATSKGTGGMLIIQAFKTLSDNKLSLELTGNQHQVMQESMKAARTVAWNVLPPEYQDQIRKEEVFGLHMHVPDTSTPKDGPSAGGAITCAIVSRLTGIPIRNDVATTGEICLEGKIRAIGGLEYKLQGAKKAGVKKVVIPKENHKDLLEAKKRYPELFDDQFSVTEVETIQELLQEVLVLDDLSPQFQNLT